MCHFRRRTHPVLSLSLSLSLSHTHTHALTHAYAFPLADERNLASSASQLEEFPKVSDACSRHHRVPLGPESEIPARGRYNSRAHEARITTLARRYCFSSCTVDCALSPAIHRSSSQHTQASLERAGDASKTERTHSETFTFLTSLLFFGFLFLSPLSSLPLSLFDCGR